MIEVIKQSEFINQKMLSLIELKKEKHVAFIDRDIKIEKYCVTINGKVLFLRDGVYFDISDNITLEEFYYERDTKFYIFDSKDELLDWLKD